MPRSIFSRKRDLVYLIYILVSLPAMLLMDLQAIYPKHLVPNFMKQLSAFYVDQYKDQFFINHPPFFQTFIFSELLFQLPVMLWAVPNILNDSPKVPLALFPLSSLVFITTGTCIVELLNWNVPTQQKIDLLTLYTPVLGVSGFMMIDMFFRINTAIDRSSESIGSRKRQ